MKKVAVLLLLTAATPAHAESCVNLKGCYMVVSERGGSYAAGWGLARGKEIIIEQKSCESVKLTYLNDGTFSNTSFKTDGRCHNSSVRDTIDSRQVAHYESEDRGCPSLDSKPTSTIVKERNGTLTYTIYDDAGSEAASGKLEPTSESPSWMNSDFSCP